MSIWRARLAGDHPCDYVDINAHSAAEAAELFVASTSIDDQIDGDMEFLMNHGRSVMVRAESTGRESRYTVTAEAVWTFTAVAT